MGKKGLREASGPKVDARKVRASPGRRSAAILFRVSPSEQREMAEMAERLGVTVSDYLRQLHRQAVESLKGGRNG